jgi:hypothetical protein
MADGKLLAAVAFGAALVAGGATGALLGPPSVSLAQDGGDSTTTTDDDPEERCEGYGQRGFALHGGGWFEPAAEALGMSEDELRDALAEEDTSLADVAEQQGVEVQELIDALVASANERIDDAVADGDLDADEADELKDDVADRIEDAVDNDGFGRGRPFGPGRRFSQLGPPDAPTRTMARPGDGVT